MNHPDHDVPVGKLERCQITGSEDLFEIIDLGHQAPCDSMLTKEQLDQPEMTYPLRLFHCPESGLAQLDYVVDNAKMFHPEYPYRSGISKPLVAYQHAFAASVIEKFGLDEGTFCVDIGSNDGTLLRGFSALNMKVLGVEPTNVAFIAREDGVETVHAFFTEQLAKDLVASEGQARIVTATNVFAHMASLGEICRGICALLADDGVFITESHYLLDVLRKNQFDTILHEHLRTYSLKSLVKLFPYYGLEVFDVERGDRYGGNIRAFVGWKGKYPIAPAVGELLKLEDEYGLHEKGTWAGFRNRVNENRDRFMEFAWHSKRSGETFAAQACPGRCSTLLNYYGVTKDLIPYIGELPGSLKIGLHLPGSHIPVVEGERMVAEQPLYVLINAWHYLDAVTQRLRQEGVRAIFVAALPEFTILPH